MESIQKNVDRVNNDVYSVNISYHRKHRYARAYQKGGTMRIVIASAAQKESRLGLYLTLFAAKLERTAGHAVRRFDLAGMDINFCTGCFNCWVKYPGRCIHTDDMENIFRAVAGADLLICASEVSAGFLDYRLKTMHDRLLPMVMPYIELVNGECHHQKRYEKSVDLAVLLDRSNSGEAGDQEFIERIYHRIALNFRSSLFFVKSIDQPVEEIVHETIGA